MKKSTTNVKPDDLNYSTYSQEQYDREIVHAIPFHRELHEQLIGFLQQQYATDRSIEVLDWGVGTGITSGLVRQAFPESLFDVVDFSKNMLGHARDRLGEKKIRYIQADFSTLSLDKEYGIIMTVIGLHHQSVVGARHLINKAYAHLKQGGLLMIGDLMTSADKVVTAVHTARHYHHLVEKAASEQELVQWAYHHIFLNDLKTIEDHRQWFETAGFQLVHEWSQWNTALLIGQKA